MLTDFILSNVMYSIIFTCNNVKYLQYLEFEGNANYTTTKQKTHSSAITCYLKMLTFLETTNLYSYKDSNKP